MSLTYHRTGQNNIGIRENRRPQDASLRYKAHGPIQGLYEPTFWERLRGRW